MVRGFAFQADTPPRELTLCQPTYRELYASPRQQSGLPPSASPTFPGPQSLREFRAGSRDIFTPKIKAAAISTDSAERYVQISRMYYFTAVADEADFSAFGPVRSSMLCIAAAAELAFSAAEVKMVAARPPPEAAASFPESFPLFCVSAAVREKMQ